MIPACPGMTCLRFVPRKQARRGRHDEYSRKTRRARQKSGSAEPILGIRPETRVENRLWDFCRGRQTKPIFRADTQNEPNFPRGAGRDGATEAWDAGQMCKTNPIRGSPAGIRAIGCAKRSQSRRGRAGWGHRGTGRGTNVQNEPNSQRGPVGQGPGAGDARQTCKTNPIWPGQAGLREGEMCKTNPILGSAAWPQERGTRDNRAKRTQFGPGGSYRQDVMCETNPIFTHTEESVGQVPPCKGCNCAKRTQFPVAGYPPTIPVQCLLCETKPISARQADPMYLEQTICGLLRRCAAGRWKKLMAFRVPCLRLVGMLSSLVWHVYAKP